MQVHPQANMPSLVSQGFKWDDYAMEVDTDDPFFRQLNLTIQVNADFVNLPIFSVDVSIDYPPWTAKHGVQTFSFRKSDDIGKFNAFIEGGSTKCKYRYTVNYKGESRVFVSAEKDFEGNDLKINVDELGLWLVDVEVGDMNFDQVVARGADARTPAGRTRRAADQPLPDRQGQQEVRGQGAAAAPGAAVQRLDSSTS